MNEGTIKFFNEANNGGQDVFVHVTGLNGTVRENDAVTYAVENGQKGPHAVNVNVI